MTYRSQMGNAQAIEKADGPNLGASAHCSAPFDIAPITSTIAASALRVRSVPASMNHLHDEETVDAARYHDAARGRPNAYPALAKVKPPGGGALGGFCLESRPLWRIGVSGDGVYAKATLTLAAQHGERLLPFGAMRRHVGMRRFCRASPRLPGASLRAS
jgi:hypothetical protein